MALTLRGHGGGCCGMRHISGFYGTVDAIKADLIGKMAQVPQGKVRCRLIEIVLTQAQRKKYGEMVEELGFKIVSRFNNANSSSTLNVYHYVKHAVVERKPKEKVGEPATKG